METFCVSSIGAWISFAGFLVFLLVVLRTFTAGRRCPANPWGPGATTLPMFIFAKVRLGVTPDINAITTIIIVLVAVAVTTAAIVTNRRATAAVRRTASAS